MVGTKYNFRMDKKTQKLIQKYSLSEEMLKNETLTIEMDLSGYKPFISEQVNSLDLEMVENPTKQLSGGEIFNIIGNAASILGLLDQLAKHLGETAQVGVFVVAIGGVVLMSIVQAREIILKQIAEKEENNKTGKD